MFWSGFESHYHLSHNHRITEMQTLNFPINFHMRETVAHTFSLISIIHLTAPNFVCVPIYTFRVKLLPENYSILTIFKHHCTSLFIPNKVLRICWNNFYERRTTFMQIVHFFAQITEWGFSLYCFCYYHICDKFLFVYLLWVMFINADTFRWLQHSDKSQDTIKYNRKI